MGKEAKVLSHFLKWYHQRTVATTSCRTAEAAIGHYLILGNQINNRRQAAYYYKDFSYLANNLTAMQLTKR